MADSNSKKLFLILSSFILILVLRAKVLAAATDGADVPSLACNSNLRSILPPPYSDLSSVTCSLIWQQRFAFSFFQDSDNVTTIVLSGKHVDRWIGIAFSSDGKMVGSSAVVGWVGKDGASGIKQYSLEGKNVTKVVPDRGNLRFTHAKPMVILRGDILYLAFQLQFSSSLAFQPILLAIGAGNPYKDHFLPMHINKTSTFIEFSSAHLSGQPTDVNDMRRYHGWAAIVGWGILTPAGAMIARYFRHVEPVWYYLHSSTQFIGFFFGLIAISIGRNLYVKINAIFLIHKVVGFCVFVLAGLEVCQFVGRPSRDSKLRKYWNCAHYWVGRAAVVLGVVNIFIGFHGVAADLSLKLVFVVAFASLLITVIVLERRLRRENSILEKIEEPPVFRVMDKTVG